MFHSMFFMRYATFLWSLRSTVHLTSLRDLLCFIEYKVNLIILFQAMYELALTDCTNTTEEETIVKKFLLECCVARSYGVAVVLGERLWIIPIRLVTHSTLRKMRLFESFSTYNLMNKTDKNNTKYKKLYHFNISIICRRCLFGAFLKLHSVHMNVVNRNNNNIRVIVSRKRLFAGKERQTDRCSRPSCGCDKSIAWRVRDIVVTMSPFKIKFR